MPSTDRVTQIEAELRWVERENGLRRGQRFYTYYPDCTPRCRASSLNPKDHASLCRVLYGPHMRLMEAGAVHRERLFLKANRVGGTEAALWELTAHMTGLYPKWWKGRKFDRAIKCWAAGDTMLTTRDILQVGLMGPLDGVDQNVWTGMLPGGRVTHIARKGGGVPKCIEQVWVKHVSGQMSVLEFRSYDQGSRAFMGTEQDLILLDEEPPQAVYTECLLRTMTTNGLILAIFTPLQGLTPFITDYLKDAVTFDDAGQTIEAAGVLGIVP